MIVPQGSLTVKRKWGGGILADAHAASTLRQIPASLTVVAAMSGIAVRRCLSSSVVLAHPAEGTLILDSQSKAP